MLLAVEGLDTITSVLVLTELGLVLRRVKRGLGVPVLVFLRCFWAGHVLDDID